MLVRVCVRFFLMRHGECVCVCGMNLLKKQRETEHITITTFNNETTRCLRVAQRPSPEGKVVRAPIWRKMQLSVLSLSLSRSTVYAAAVTEAKLSNEAPGRVWGGGWERDETTMTDREMTHDREVGGVRNSRIR